MVNKIIIQGHMTKDPELRQTQNNIPFCNFTIGWSEKYKETETKCFPICKAWRGTAEFVSKYFKKGSQVIVEGRLIDEDWGKEGEHNTVKVIDVEKVHFCGSKSSQDAPAPKADPAAADSAFMDLSAADEELPFV